MEKNIVLVSDVLKYTYGIVPIVAGLDKFTNVLTNWSQYVSLGMINLIPIDPNIFMMIIGVIEIVAGVLVLSRPKIGGIVLMIWLICIALTLLLSGQFIDVAVRDLVMAVGAFSLSKLSEGRLK